MLEPTEFMTSLNRGRRRASSTTFAVGWSGRVDPDGNIYGFVTTQGSQNDSGYSNPKLDYVARTRRAQVGDAEQARIDALPRGARCRSSTATGR